MGKPDSRSFVLITGATAGIGYELAKIYANDGHNLILVARNIDRLEQVKNEFNLIYNVNIHILSVDLAVDNSAETILNYVNKKNLTVDILINNAGIGSFGYFKELDINKEIDQININVRALTELTRLFLPIMMNNETGSILNVASTAAFCAGPKMATYYASKAFVLSFTEAIYEEIKGSNVRISCLCPGTVKTEFLDKAGIKKKEISKNNMMTAKEVARLAYRDFNRGKLIIIPGFKNKLIIGINKIIPRSLSRKIILLMNKGN